MLVRLIIKNYAIISELDLSLPSGLSVITGETGAGKSILLGALGLALGRRSDSRVLTDDHTKCIVEAHFKIKDNEIEEIFTREGLDFDEFLICRREITGGGKSRSFINDTPVQLKLMQEITDHLIELHQQNDNLALQSRDYQVQSLDVLSKSVKEFRQYRSQYKELASKKNELVKFRVLEISSARRKDFLQFQINELESAQLKEGELEKLEDTQNLLQHAEAINGVLEQLQIVLNQGQHSILNQLIHLAKQLDSIKNVSVPLNLIGERINALRVEVQDLAMEAGRLEGMDRKDPAQLSRIETRLSQLYTLIKKYQARNEKDLIELVKSLKKELDELASVHEQISLLEKEIGEDTSELIKTGDILSQKRKAGAKKIVPEMNGLIAELGMPNGKFSIEISQKVDPGPDGMDEITFLFSANKGVAMQPLQLVASGGELSRLSLALKSLYAAKADLPTIIFDEIDTGISGEVAWRMGQLIRSLAKGHQVVMITHSPQIAAHASTQYHVSKVLINGKDTSSIQLLSKESRMVEIAKMLSGDPPSKEALANAESLVGAIKN